MDDDIRLGYEKKTTIVPPIEILAELLRHLFHGNPDACVGAFLLGTKGFMLFPDYTSYYTFLGPKREPGPHAAMPNTAQRWHVMDTGKCFGRLVAACAPHVGCS